MTVANAFRTFAAATGEQRILRQAGTGSSHAYVNLLVDWNHICDPQPDPIGTNRGARGGRTHARIGLDFLVFGLDADDLLACKRGEQSECKTKINTR